MQQVFAFFKVFSWETDLFSNARWFNGKKCKIGKENLYLTENRLGKNKMRCMADNHNYMCHICAKRFLELDLMKQLLTKYQIFKKLPPNFTKIIFFKSIIETF